MTAEGGFAGFVDDKRDKPWMRPWTGLPLVEDLKNPASQ